MQSTTTTKAPLVPFFETNVRRTHRRWYSASMGPARGRCRSLFGHSSVTQAPYFKWQDTDPVDRLKPSTTHDTGSFQGTTGVSAQDSMAIPGGLEPPTCWLEVSCSIQLSYGACVHQRFLTKRSTDWFNLQNPVTLGNCSISWPVHTDGSGTPRFNQLTFGGLSAALCCWWATPICRDDHNRLRSNHTNFYLLNLPCLISITSRQGCWLRWIFRIAVKLKWITLVTELKVKWFIRSK